MLNAIQRIETRQRWCGTVILSNAHFAACRTAPKGFRLALDDTKKLMDYNTRAIFILEETDLAVQQSRVYCCAARFERKKKAGLTDGSRFSPAVQGRTACYGSWRLN